MSAKTLRAWCLVHKWTSLVCTIFLLLLCVTGLPLVFYHELEHLLGEAVEPPAMAAGTPHAPLDRALAAAAERHPQEYVQFVSWDEEEPDLLYLSLARTPDADPSDNRLLVVDARTGGILAEPPTQEGVLYVFYTLHVDLFAGLPGKLFLGAMGLLFVASLVSGAVVYGPFMRKLAFGDVRFARARRTRWLDLHNLLGIASLTWALVVGATGVINTWADVIIDVWQADQLAELVAPYEGQPPASRLSSLDAAVAAARAAAPGMVPSFVAFPQSSLSSDHHYAVFLRGETPFTAKLLKPVLVDAETSALTASPTLPWYVTALLVSQPLHFGDYGGMPMKALWALLDLVTIAVLGSGVYLWLGRGPSSIDARIEAMVREAERPDASAIEGAAS